MNYDNPDMTLRTGVENSLSAVQDQIADLDAMMETTQGRAGNVFDPVTAGEMNGVISSLRARKNSLQQEAARLQGVLDEWQDEAAA